LKAWEKTEGFISSKKKTDQNKRGSNENRGRGEYRSAVAKRSQNVGGASGRRTAYKLRLERKVHRGGVRNYIQNNGIQENSRKRENSP